MRHFYHFKASFFNEKNVKINIKYFETLKEICAELNVSSKTIENQRKRPRRGFLKNILIEKVKEPIYKKVREVIYKTERINDLLPDYKRTREVFYTNIKIDYTIIPNTL